MSVSTKTIWAEENITQNPVSFFINQKRRAVFFFFISLGSQSKIECKGNRDRGALPGTHIPICFERGTRLEERGEGQNGGLFTSSILFIRILQLVVKKTFSVEKILSRHTQTNFFSSSFNCSLSKPHGRSSFCSKIK